LRKRSPRLRHLLAVCVFWTCLFNGQKMPFYSRSKALLIPSSYFAAVTKARKRRTSRLQSAWLKHGANEMAEKLTNYDPAEDLTSDEAIAIFMAEAFQTNDTGYIAHALGVVARVKGMAQIAVQTGLSREQLCRSFSENGNPTLKTTLAVMKALGIELTVKVPADA
jgi:probable addiction module antidote protein